VRFYVPGSPRKRFRPPPRGCSAWRHDIFVLPESTEGPEAALQEIDDLIVALEGGQTPPRPRMSVLFAPTGPIQEVSLSSGWGEEFLALAARFDAAAETFSSRGSWWRRLMIWQPGSD
jgi:hypothetical protein